MLGDSWSPNTAQLDLCSGLEVETRTPQPIQRAEDFAHARQRPAGDHSVLTVQSTCPDAAGGPLPEGWEDHVGQLSCSDEWQEILRSMGLIPDA